MQEVGKQICIIAHTAHHCLKDAVELTRHAQTWGHTLRSWSTHILQARMMQPFTATTRSFAAIDIGISLFNAPYVVYSMTPELIA